MPTDLDLRALADEVAHLNNTEPHRWRLTSVPNTLRVYGELQPASSEDTFVLRIDFGESLAAGPPSVVFVEKDTLREGVLTAWPRGATEYFKHPPQQVTGWICNPWTREGRHHHAEWRDEPWPANRPIWRVMTAMQDILDRPGYQGRAA